MHRIVSQLILISLACACLHATDLPPAVNAQVAVEDGDPLPVVSARRVSSALLSSMLLDTQLRAIRRFRMLSACKVEPLSEIGDSEAAAFEKNVETAPADVYGLAPDTAQALGTFQELVSSMGGTFELQSAYRPSAYQAHLHEVWVKWIKELRKNRSSGCGALREEVGAEFARHRLLVRQQPVPVSDHERGLAFDAAIAMPRAARLNGKRVTLDKLAALAGIRRPAPRKDPVHFKLVAERPATISYAQIPSF